MTMEIRSRNTLGLPPTTRMDTQEREGSCYGENLMWMWNARMVDQEEEEKLAVDLSRMLPNLRYHRATTSTGALRHDTDSSFPRHGRSVKED